MDESSFRCSETYCYCRYLRTMQIIRKNENVKRRNKTFHQFHEYVRFVRINRFQLSFCDSYSLNLGDLFFVFIPNNECALHRFVRRL